MAKAILPYATGTKGTLIRSSMRVLNLYRDVRMLVQILRPYAFMLNMANPFAENDYKLPLMTLLEKKALEDFRKEQKKAEELEAELARIREEMAREKGVIPDNG